MSKLTRQFFRNVTDLSPDNWNCLYAQGYRYWCYGNYRRDKSYIDRDGWYGIDYDLYVFVDKDEAEAFFKQNQGIDGYINKLYAIPEHTPSYEEQNERKKQWELAEERKKADKKQLALERETARATAAGMSLDDYRKTKKYIKYLQENQEEIANYSRYITRLQARNADIRKWLEEHPLP